MQKTTVKTDKVKWERSTDFIDNTARYAIEGRDPQNSLEPIQAVIVSEKEREYPGGPMVTKYRARVSHVPTEHADDIGPFRSLATAKLETVKLFNEYLAKFN